MAGLLETRAIAVLKAYSDESGVHDSAVAFSIAGWLAPASEWQKFARSWGKVLKREGIKNFHMTDLLAGHGEFVGWERERRTKLIESLVEAVCSTAALGFSSSIIRGPKGQRRGMARMITEQPYVAAFGRQVLGLVNRADSFLGAEQKIGFVFDSHEEWSGRALKLYNSMKAASEPLGDRVRRLGPIAFESCDGESFLPLHAADLLAWEVRNFLEDRERDPGARPRHSLSRLCHSERVHVHVTGERELNPQFGRVLYELAVEGVPLKLTKTRPKWAR